MSEQYHFEFKDYKAAFEMFYRKKLGYDIFDDDGKKLGRREGNPDICLVISTGWAVSGYWIEENAKSDKDSTVYRSVKAVQELEKRVKAQNSLRQNHEISADRGKLVL